MVFKNKKTLAGIAIAAGWLAAPDGLATGSPQAALNPAVETCTGIPVNDPAPPVEVCEGRYTYRFRIEDETTVYSKAEYRERIEGLIRDYAQRAGIQGTALSGATVTFWLSVPEAAPGDAWGRAVIAGPDHHFLVNLPLDLATASVESSMVANLGARHYPDYLGHRVGNFLVKKVAGADDREFRDFIIAAGATGVADSAGGWTKFLSPDFSEATMVDRIAKDPGAKTLVAGAQVNELFEWIAWREPVFRFRFQNARK